MDTDYQTLKATFDAVEKFIKPQANQIANLDAINNFVKTLPLPEQLTFLNVFGHLDVVNGDDLIENGLDLKNRPNPNYLFDESSLRDGDISSPYTYAELYQQLTYTNVNLAD